MLLNELFFRRGSSNRHLDGWMVSVFHEGKRAALPNCLGAECCKVSTKFDNLRNANVQKADGLRRRHVPINYLHTPSNGITAVLM